MDPNGINKRVYNVVQMDLVFICVHSQNRVARVLPKNFHTLFRFIAKILKKSLQVSRILRSQATCSLPQMPRFKSPEVTMKALVYDHHNDRLAWNMSRQNLRCSFHHVLLLLPPNGEVGCEAGSLLDGYPKLTSICHCSRCLFACLHSMFQALEASQLPKPDSCSSSHHGVEELNLKFSD